MDEALKQWQMSEQDQRISEAVARDRPRLRNFIRRRVADPGDAEDILQDVFYELVEAYRMMKPVEQVTAWLFQVARNRITDLFRRRRREKVTNEADLFQTGLSQAGLSQLDPAHGGEARVLEELLPSPDGGPDAAYARAVLLEELDEALDELPEEQREVFIAHELMGYSFKELAADSGVSVNTLLSRKHYAVMHLRERLRSIYEEFTKG